MFVVVEGIGGSGVVGASDPHAENVVHIMSVASRCGSCNAVRTRQLRWHVRASGGSGIELLLPQPVPELGDKVPLRVEHFSNNARSYSVDVTKWQTEGSP